MGPIPSLIIFVLGVCPALALPDLVVRITPTLPTSDLFTTASDNNDATIEFLARRALFGSRDHFLQGALVRPSEYDPFLCEPTSFDVDYNGNDGIVMLVPRGKCSLERKAHNAKKFYGADAIMIYDRLAERYGWNETTQRVIFPQAQVEYECGNGYAVMNDLPLDPPAYNDNLLDPIMGAKTKTANSRDVFTTAACNLTNTALNPCDSQLCLVTSHKQNSTEFPVCCAWDEPRLMAKEEGKDFDTDDILALWVTIRQSELILQSDLLSFDNLVSIETRGSKSYFNVSYIFMWAWGTLVMAVGAWYAAGDYRRFSAKLSAYKAKEANKQTRHRASREDNDQSKENTIGGSKDDLESGESSFQDEIDDKIAKKGPKQRTEIGKKRNKETKKKTSSQMKGSKEGWSLHSLPPPERKQKRSLHRTKDQAGKNSSGNHSSTAEDSENETQAIPSRESGTITPFELTQWHVVGFIVMASLTLIILFFWKVYTLFFILYGIGCAGSISYLVFNPLVASVIPRLGNSWVEEFNKPVMCQCNGFSVTSQLLAYTWAGVWLWYGITRTSPETNAFFWVTLNIFGACFCTLSITVLKLTSIKIATILLVGIFFYDIFFVFITPFLTGGSSVMLQVASGSDDPTTDDFCLRYPDERYCKGVKFLPMLFMLPKVNDYTNGSVILGLGDIILPGFLIAFSSRHDEAVRFVRTHTSNISIGSSSKSLTWYDGYFFPMMMAYSLGLFFAYLALVLMEQGQPALLYICPICLTTILVLGRNDIKNLWNGAEIFKEADRLIAKTERDWGKRRMKRFAERRRRENGDLTATDNELDSEKLSEKRSAKGLSEEDPSDLTLSEPNKIEPRPKDICFGNGDHPGTKFLRSVVKEVAGDLGKEEYKPKIYKIVKARLKGRRFFILKNKVWEEASKLETRTEIGKLYDRVRGRRSSVMEDIDQI